MGSDNSRAYITIPEIPYPKNRSHFIRHLIYEFPFNNLSDPKFWNEFDLSILHLFDENQRPNENYVTPHTPKQLFELFYGCSEILPNSMDILEAIIQKSIIKNRTSYNLSLLFDFHQRYSFSRFNSFLITKNYYYKVDFLNTLRDSKGNTFPYNIQSLTNVISKIYNIFTSKKFPYSSDELEEIQKISDAINHALPPNEISAPINKFYSNHPGQRMTFMAHNVYPHCITSNGYFLFILTDSSNLYIFPLICNGSILSPITRKMNFKIPINQNFSIASSTTYLFIFSSKFKRIYRISDLLSSLEEDINDFNTLYGIFNSRHTSTIDQFSQDDISINGNPNKEKKDNDANDNDDDVINDNEQSYVISDGMTMAQLSGDRSCKIVLSDIHTRRILNYKSSIKTLNYLKPIALTPIAISGAFIAFFSHIDQQTFIMKVFSLVTGHTVIEEQFSTIDQILAVTIDSINHCSYAVIPGINGNMEVRRFSFMGSYTPFLFNFSYKIYNTNKKAKKKNAFKEISSSFNILMVQLLGTHIIPPPLLVTDHKQMQTIIEALKKLSSEDPTDIKIKFYYLQCLQFLASLIDLNIRSFEIRKNQKEEKNDDITSSKIAKDKEDDDKQTTNDEKMNKEDEIIPNEMLKQILALIPSLPTNIGSFLFFLHVPLFFEISIDHSINILYHIFNTLNNPKLGIFCLNQLEKSECISRIPFDTDNSISLLIPKTIDSTVNSISSYFLSFLYVHQHVLISTTFQYLETSPPIIFINNDKGNNDDDLIQFEKYHKPHNKNGENKTPVDYFLDYAFVVVSRFISAISDNSTNITQTTVFNSLIYKIFDNFLRTLSYLSESNQIAQPITVLLSIVIQKLALIPIDANNKDQKSITNSINFVYYIFAQYVKTLFKGGGQSIMEKSFYWLIKPNLDLSEKHDSEWISHLDSTEFDHFDDEKIGYFINNNFPVSKSKDKPKKSKKKSNKIKYKDIDVKKLMDLLYNKYKKQFNRKLNDQIQQFDRIVLIGIANHMKLIHDILKFNEKSTLTPELKSALDQMIRIRSAFRQIIQRKGDTVGIMKRALFLCRINSNCTDAKKLGEFITSHINVSALVKIILVQPSRIQITMTGFSILSKMVELKTENNIFLSCISDCLSNIEDFSGFSSIVLSANLSEKQKSKVYQFFSNIFKIYREVRNPQFILIAFRFFRHLNKLKSLQAKLFLKVNEILKEDVNDLSLFPLVYLLVKKFSKLSRHKIKYDKDDNNDPFLSKDFDTNFDMNAPVNWLLLCAYLNINFCSEDLFHTITKFFWKLSKSDNESHVTPRVICRAIYNALMKDNLNSNSNSVEEMSSASIDPNNMNSSTTTTTTMNAYLIGNKIQDNTILKFIKKALVFISNSLLGNDLKLNKFAIELVYLFRKIINSTPIADLNTKPTCLATQILNDLMNTPKYFKATLAIIGLQVDIVRPYVLIRQNFKEKEYSPNASLIRKSSAVAESPLPLQSTSSSKFNLENKNNNNNNNLSSSRLLPEYNDYYSTSNTTVIDYISIPNAKDLKFIPLPFNIKSPSRSLKNADVHAFPLLEVNEDVLSSFGNYILSFIDSFTDLNKSKSKNKKLFNDLVVQNLFIQTLSYLAMRPEFVNEITSDFIRLLSSKMELFSSINDLFDDAISIISQVEEVKDDIDGLYKIKGEKYDSYLTKPLINYVANKHQKLSFLLDLQINENSDKDFYFGIVSDSFYQHNIRYELIHYPSGSHYPIGNELKEMKSPLTIDINIDERNFYVNSTKFNFPQGTRFRFVISTKTSDSTSLKPKFTITSNDKYVSFFQENGTSSDDDNGYDENDSDDDDDENQKQKQNLNLENNYFLKDSPEDNESLSQIPSDIFLKVKDYHNEYLNDLSKLTKSVTLPKKLIPKSYDDITPVDYEVPSISVSDEKRYYYTPPPNEIPLHIFDSKKASKHLIRVIWNSYINKLSGQFATVCLMRIALNNPFQLVLQPDQNSNSIPSLSNISELFMNLILSTESFHPDLFMNKKFFFGLDSPPWLSQALTANSSQNVVSGYESEALEALNTLINLDEDFAAQEDEVEIPIISKISSSFSNSDTNSDSTNSNTNSNSNSSDGDEKVDVKDKAVMEPTEICVLKKLICKEIIRGMAKRIYHLASKPRCHICAVDNPYVHFYPRDFFQNNSALDLYDIPEFMKNSLLAVPKFQSKLADFPIFIGQLIQANESYNYESIYSLIHSVLKNSETVFINVKRYDNSWVKDTIFEMFLLLKNFIFIIKESDLEIFVKSILIELYISGSPFSRSFVIDFITKLDLQHPISPIYSYSRYIQKLAVLGTYLQSLPPSQSQYVTRNATSNSMSPSLSNSLSNANLNTKQEKQFYSLNLNTDDFFRLLYRIDSKVINDPINRKIIKHFPEFFTDEDQQKIKEIIKLTESTKTKNKNDSDSDSDSDDDDDDRCLIRKVFIDPGAIKSTDTLVDELLIMIKIQQGCKSIAGFPFWEILPFYYRLLTYDENDKENRDFIPPTVYKDENGIVIIDNPTGVQLHISIVIVQGNFYSSSVLMYSVSPLFEVAEYVTKDKVDDVITIKEGKTYFSMTGFRGIWKIKFIDEFLHKHKKENLEFSSTDNNSNTPSVFKREVDNESNEDDVFEIKVHKIKKKFIQDMKMFAVDWTNEDTEILSNQIPPNGTKNKRFQAVSSIAESCTQLTEKYSPIVVKLRALFIHHFNYFLYVSSQSKIRSSPYFNSKIAMEIPDEFKMMLKEWVSDEEASKSLFDAIKCNESYREITINRFISKRLVEEGKGNFNDSIIGQLSRQFSRFDPSLFRNKTRPWTVTFEEEKAVDAGGPMRELMTEVARSIFLPSSEIFIPIREYFIPFAISKPKSLNEEVNELNTNINTNAGNNTNANVDVENEEDKNVNAPLNFNSIRRNSNSTIHVSPSLMGNDLQRFATRPRRNSNANLKTSVSAFSLEHSFTENCKEMKLKMYWAVGQFIAIIVRTGFPQSLPFAPLVWKYIAEAKITREDVFASDPEFASNMKKMLAEPDLYINSSQVLNWQTTQWDGTLVTLPQHVGKNQSQSIQNKTQAMFTAQNTTKYRNQKRNPQLNIFVNECVRFRIDSILPMLKEIRKGFTANVGFEFNPILSGKLLSHLAQGSDIITVEQLKSLTVALDFDGEGEMQYIDRFWRIVERFTSLQRHHMLRFITTLTRIPITTKSQFGIKIDKLTTPNPDIVLPTASTCFNKLHWPCYTNDDVAYEKFSFAIENCQSLDLT